MERLAICRICLNANGSHLIPEMQLQEMYKKLTSISFQNISKPSLVCYLCHAKLYKAHRLMLQCLKAEEFLMHMFNQLLASKDQVQQESIDVDGTKVTSLVCTAVQHIDIEPQTDIKERIRIMYEEDDIDIKTEVESGGDIPEPGDDLHQAPELSDVDNEQTCIDSKIDIPLYYIKETSERITDDENITRVEKKELIGWTKGAPVIKKSAPYTQNNKNEINKFQDNTDLIKRTVTHDHEVSKSKCSIETKASIFCEGITDKEINNKQDGVDISVNDYCLWNDSMEFQHNEKYIMDTLIVDESNTSNIANDTKKTVNSVISNKTVNNTIAIEISLQNVTSDYQHDKESDIDYLEQCKIPQNNYRYYKNIKKDHEFNTHSENEAQFICDICTRSFDCKSKLLRHVQVHSVVRPYICKICDKRFTQTNNLKRHERLHNGDRPYNCKICDKSFTQMGALKSHQRIHSGERPYSCKICDKRFPVVSTLRKHERVHTGERPYSCKICNMRFTATGSLKMHERIHTGERPYSCKICDKRFTVMGGLRTHERIHTGERPYSCKTCDKSFTQKQHLRSHEHIHTNDRP